MAPEHPLYSRSVMIHFQYPTISGAQTLESIFWPLKPGPRPCCNRTVRTGDFPCWMHTFWSLVLQQEDQQKHLAAEGFYFYTSIQVKIFKYPNSPQRITLHLLLDLQIKIKLKKKKERKKKYKTPPPNTMGGLEMLPLPQRLTCRPLYREAKCLCSAPQLLVMEMFRCFRKTVHFNSNVSLFRCMPQPAVLPLSTPPANVAHLLMNECRTPWLCYTGRLPFPY